MLGGPAMLIGLGGGAASSVSSGRKRVRSFELHISSHQERIQRWKKMPRRLIQYLLLQWMRAFIEFVVHAVGVWQVYQMQCLSLLKIQNRGVYVRRDKIPVSDPAMSPFGNIGVMNLKKDICASNSSKEQECRLKKICIEKKV